MILAGVNKLLQTIYHDHQLAAVALHEATGKLAVAAGNVVYVYKPNGRGNGYIEVPLPFTLQLHSWLLTGPGVSSGRSKQKSLSLVKMPLSLHCRGETRTNSWSEAVP